MPRARVRSPRFRTVSRSWPFHSGVNGDCATECAAGGLSQESSLCARIFVRSAQTLIATSRRIGDLKRECRHFIDARAQGDLEQFARRGNIILCDGDRVVGLIAGHARRLTLLAWTSRRSSRSAYTRLSNIQGRASARSGQSFSQFTTSRQRLTDSRA